MKHMKKSIVILALSLASGSALADWEGAGWNTGLSYSHFSESDLSLGAVTANAGYKFENGYSKLSIMPQIRIGTGVKDDAGVEIDRYLVVATRFDYQVSSDVSLFLQPAYGNIEVGSYDNWEFGVGVGSTFSVNKDWDLELMYEEFDGTDVISFGVAYNY